MLPTPPVRRGALRRTQLLAPFVALCIAAACSDPDLGLDALTCDGIEADLVRMTEKDRTSKGFALIKVEERKELQRSNERFDCEGRAQWSNGATSTLSYGAYVDQEGAVIIQYNRAAEPVERPADGAPASDVTAIDPATLTCETLRPQVVALAEKDRISRGYSMVQIYDPTVVSSTPERLTCSGRAMWTNGREGQIEFGYFIDSEGAAIVTFKSADEARIGG